MKNSTQIKKSMILLILTTMIIIGTVSCKNDRKTADTKEIAADHNEIKFGKTNKATDALFLVYAAELNLKGIQLGQLAQQKSKVVDIKKLGKMMEESHQKSQNELTALAYKKSMSLPISLTDASQKDFAKLSDILDAGFDKEYCDMMVKEHQDAIIEFDKAAIESTDPDIQAWAAITLPVLHMHLDHSLACQKNIKP